MKKERADVLLVSRGLAESRERARALILAGRVYRGELRVEKAGEKLPPDTALEVRGELHPYVSRGGVKLAGALDSFGVSVAGRAAADFGASTGGFTDCLLRRGAAKVYAIDVGYGQLHPKLRNDPRVVVMERTNARHLRQGSLPEAVDLVVVDASFIGLEKLLPAARAILSSEGEILGMVKPQFQVGPERLSRGGVVRDDALRREAVDEVARAAAALGLEEVARVDAAIAGPRGNVECFLRLRPSRP
jgi:23S rRNA (cytidine1920-2'-O)/16S rRNA (cytidine1409-2'-O)-methyltransferase